MVSVYHGTLFCHYRRIELCHLLENTSGDHHIKRNKPNSEGPYSLSNSWSLDYVYRYTKAFTCIEGGLWKKDNYLEREEKEAEEDRIGKYDQNIRYI